MRSRKNYLPTAIVTLLFWTALGFWVWQISPEGRVEIVIFFILAFGALWFPLSIIFTNARRGLMVTIGVLGSLAMKPLGMFSYLSLAAWWGIMAVLEYWFSSKD
jgi:hypothetical protein